MNLRTTENDFISAKMYAEHTIDHYPDSTLRELFCKLIADHIALKTTVVAYERCDKSLREERAALVADFTIAKQETADALHELRSAVGVIEKSQRLISELLTWWRTEGRRESTAYGAPGVVFSLDAFLDDSCSWLTLHTQQTKAPLMGPEIQRRLHEATIILSFFILPSQQMPVELQTLFSHWQSHDEGRDFGNWLARRWLLGFPFPPAETDCSHTEGCGAPDPEAEADQ